VRLITEAAKRNRKAAPPAPRPDLPLSAVLQKHLPQVFDGRRLGAVGRGITAIDWVPTPTAVAVTALFLSDNNLRYLGAVGQFVNLRSLSLANNLIEVFDDLGPLKVRTGAT
jgi:hypothetical protein